MWSLVYVDETTYRHRQFAIQGVIWRGFIFFHSCQILPGIAEIILCTAVEILALRTSALHFNEAGLFIRMSLGCIALSLGAICWVVVWGVFFRSLHDSAQQLEAEKDAMSSLLSMVSDASFWLAADGDTLLESDRNLEAILGRNVQGRSLKGYMPAEEHARLRALFDRLSADGRGNPVHLLSTSVLDPSTHLRAVDLFIVDRRFAFNIEADNWLFGTGQAPSQRRGFLIGLRGVQDVGVEVGMVGAPGEGEAGPAIPEHDALPFRAPSEASLPVVAECAALEAEAEVMPCDQFASVQESRVAEAAAPQMDGTNLDSQSALSVVSDDGGSWQLRVKNGFLTVTRRKADRRPGSAPGRLQHGQPGAWAATRGRGEDEWVSETGSLLSGSLLSSSLSADSSTRSAAFLLKPHTGPGLAAVKSTESCVYLTDVLQIQGRGWQSHGSSWHASGDCKVCAFHDGQRGREKCINGVLCPRCHEPHASLRSRRAKRAHNKDKSPLPGVRGGSKIRR